MLEIYSVPVCPTGVGYFCKISHVHTSILNAFCHTKFKYLIVFVSDVVRCVMWTVYWFLSCSVYFQPSPPSSSSSTPSSSRHVTTVRATAKVKVEVHHPHLPGKCLNKSILLLQWFPIMDNLLSLVTLQFKVTNVHDYSQFSI